MGTPTQRSSPLPLRRRRHPRLPEVEDGETRTRKRWRSSWRFSLAQGLLATNATLVMKATERLVSSIVEKTIPLNYELVEQLDFVQSRRVPRHDPLYLFFKDEPAFVEASFVMTRQDSTALPSCAGAACARGRNMRWHAWHGACPRMPRGKFL